MTKEEIILAANKKLDFLEKDFEKYKIEEIRPMTKTEFLDQLSTKNHSDLELQCHAIINKAKFLVMCVYGSDGHKKHFEDLTLELIKLARLEGKKDLLKELR